MIKTCLIADKSNNQPSSFFFNSASNGHPPIDVNILDAASLEYIAYKPYMAVAILYPRAKLHKSVFDLLNNIGCIVYHKRIFVSRRSHSALLRQLYKFHLYFDHASTTNFLNKVRGTAPYPGYLDVLLMDVKQPSLIRSIKKRIRSMYGISNDSIHITDGIDECHIASKALFSSNSVALLDHLAPTNGINMYLSTFKDWLVINNLDSSCFCVGGSAILALCGLRECNDLDLLYLGNPSDLPPLPEGISLHLSQETFYPYTFSEIIHDHNLHCFYLGFNCHSSSYLFIQDVSI